MWILLPYCITYTPYKCTMLVHVLHRNYTFSEVIQYVNTAPRGLCPLICGMIDRESSSWLLALGKHLNHRNRFCLIFCVINVRDRVLRLTSTFTGSAQLWATNLSDDFIYRSQDHRRMADAADEASASTRPR